MSESVRYTREMGKKNEFICSVVYNLIGFKVQLEFKNVPIHIEVPEILHIVFSRLHSHLVV